MILKGFGRVERIDGGRLTGRTEVNGTTSEGIAIVCVCVCMCSKFSYFRDQNLLSDIIVPLSYVRLNFE